MAWCYNCNARGSGYQDKRGQRGHVVLAYEIGWWRVYRGCVGEGTGRGGEKGVGVFLEKEFFGKTNHGSWEHPDVCDWRGH